MGIINPSPGLEYSFLTTGSHHDQETNPSISSVSTTSNSSEATFPITDEHICYMSGVSVQDLDYNDTYLHNFQSQSLSGSGGVPLDFSDLLNHQNGVGILNTSICKRNWDGILCWPNTPLGQTASLPCMDKFRGIPYDPSGTVTRICDIGGIWGKTNYSSCEHMLPSVVNPANSTSLDTTVNVYFFGYGLSLTALICAAIIFITFKELRCLRNTIHSHLVITYILHDALWLIGIMASVYYSKPGKHSDKVACATFIMLHYLYLTKFFWMFVEGLYLYVLVVQTFIAESIKLRTYCFIGWGIPLLVVAFWCILKWMTMDLNTLDLSATITSTINPIRDLDQNIQSCPWLHENEYDWIHKISALLCLAANMIFLLQIMWVLITKLRSATTPETQQSRKAAKALVVLMPLLGTTYILVLIGPRKVPEYEYIRAFLISTQGFLVALFYCFLNQEVRLALRHNWNRVRSLGPECSCCGCETENERRQNMQQMRDWSPRSRTESIRLYTPNSHTFRKRESSASETTTMTAVLGSYNGSSGGQNIILTTTPGRRYSSTPIYSCKTTNLGMNEDTAFI